MIRCPERDGARCIKGRSCLYMGRCLVPIGDGHHDESVTRDRDQAADSLDVADCRASRA